MKNKKLIIYICLLGLLVIVSLFGGYVYKVDPNYQNLLEANMRPSMIHLMGTDIYGRDELARILDGSKISVLVSFSVVVINSVIGLLVGVISNKNSILKGVIEWVMSVFLSIPSLVLALIISGLFENGIILALVISGWCKYGRLISDLIRGEMHKDYMDSVRLSGHGYLYQVFMHVLPNIYKSIIAMMISDIGVVMMESASLSFLGLGIKIPQAEWGNMISESRSYFQLCPWLLICPLVVMLIYVWLFKMMGKELSK